MSEERHKLEPWYIEVWKFIQICLLILVSSALALGTITGLVWMTEAVSGHKVSPLVLTVVGCVDASVIASAAIGMGVAHHLTIFNRLILPACRETWKLVERQTNGEMAQPTKLEPMNPKGKGH